MRLHKSIFFVRYLRIQQRHSAHFDLYDTLLYIVLKLVNKADLREIVALLPLRDSVIRISQTSRKKNLCKTLTSDHLLSGSVRLESK